jgi:Aspartyl protease
VRCCNHLTLAKGPLLGQLGQPEVSLLLLALFLFAGIASAQPRTFRVPFHTVNGMILLDATVNGKPAVLLLGTGADSTIISAEAAGLAAVQLKVLLATKAGTGAEGDYVLREADLKLGNRHCFNRRVWVMNLSDVSKRLGTRIDGFVGADLLQEFSAIRLDFKNRVIELEE